MKPNWTHKDTWKCRTSGFCVEVSRHEEWANDGKGIHRWCVYGYVYPTHWLFQQFEGDSFWQPACEHIPLHGGVISAVTIIRYHRDNDGNVCSVMFGIDYNHLHDERFTWMENKEEAAEVFADAVRLYEWLDLETPPAAVAAGRVCDALPETTL